MLKNRINTVIAGATGFVGLDLVKLLSKHPYVKIRHLCAQKNIGKNINYFDKTLSKKLPKIERLEKVNWNKIDILFLSLPNGQAQKLINKLYFKYVHLKFIDLSADFRLKDHTLYKKHYKIVHSAKKLINKSIYSISEFTKKEINKFRIISNPGCYPTSIQIPLVPLFKNKLIDFNNIIIDSKSGYSGAGKNYKKKFKFNNFYSSTYAYSVNFHRHIAEIDQEFGKVSKKISFTFNPHLIPTFRGILSSIYLKSKKNISIKKIESFLRNYYKKNHFIKINKINTPLGTGDVLNTNKCEISICQTRISNRIVIFSAIDNLIKGAAGQAIQNMNLLFKIKENAGLK